MSSLSRVVAEARVLVTPSAAEERKMKALADKMLSKVEEAAAGFPEVRGVLLGGSFAKGTWLPRDVDLDIFVKIAEDTDERSFEEVGLAIGRKAVAGHPYGKKHAQHPYTEAVVDDVKVNVVPCYDVKPGHWKSAADRSQYHVEFVNNNLGKAQRTQVRLLKRFMKTAGVYGAEIEHEGFSGYAAEVLVHSYGGLEGVLGYFAELKPSGEVLFTLKDPVDEGRELGTAVSKETTAKMVLASRAFLSSPSSSYFKVLKTKVRTSLEKRLYCVRFDHAILSEDTLWGELKRSTRQLVRHVEAQGFVVARASAASNGTTRSAIIILPEVDSLPALEERLGPGVELANETERFIAKNGRDAHLIWAGDDAKIHILRRRQHIELGALLRELCGNGIEAVGASREMASGIRKSGRVLVGEGIRREGAREGWFLKGVERVVTDTIGTNPSS
jgi:tRNA nucleotidyltransferase (CCA-adding enzyme)